MYRKIREEIPEQNYPQFYEKAKFQQEYAD